MKVFDTNSCAPIEAYRRSELWTLYKSACDTRDELWGRRGHSRPSLIFAAYLLFLMAAVFLPG